MNRPTKEIDRKDCALFSKEASVLDSGTTRRRWRSQDHSRKAKGQTGNSQGRRGASRSWLMRAAGVCLFVAASCDTQNKGKCDPHLKAAEINWQGIAAHEVEKARREFHVDGSGVKVCVISDSVRYLDEAKENLTLPNVAILHQDGIKQDGIQLDRSDDGEGTAMLEVVHSIAPGTELGFATFKTNMAENIKALGGENSDIAWKKCNIIVDDHEDYAESPFQDEEVSQAINDVTRKGTLYTHPLTGSQITRMRS